MSALGIPALLLAFVAGIASFASPCVLPLVPAYLGYMVGAGPGERVGVSSRTAGRVRSARVAVAFGLGFSSVFVALWASIGLVGYVLPGYVWLFRELGGVVLVFLGLHVAHVISIAALYREVRLPVGPFAPVRRLAPLPGRESSAAPTSESGSAGGIGQAALLGVVFSAGWTPCIGPILGGIIGLASASESVAAGTVLLVAYSAGLAVPFVLVALGATSVTGRWNWFRDHHRLVSAFTGAMLVAVGFLMITNSFVRLSSMVPALPFLEGGAI